jgi:hypothetical protein
MNGLLNTVAQSAIARATILVLVAVPLIFYFGFTPAERSTIGLTAAYYLGFYSPAAALAAIIGWLTWSWKWFWIAMGIGFGLTALLHLRSAGLLEWISADQGVILALVFFIVCVCAMAAPYCKKS